MSEMRHETTQYPKRLYSYFRYVFYLLYANDAVSVFFLSAFEFR